jgi:hypothetical protein
MLSGDPEEIIMPMCKSPRISDVLRRARSPPANDNRLLVETARSFHKPKRSYEIAWPALVVLLGVGVLIFL